MKLVLLTNILNPYRKAFYDELAAQCRARGDDFHVLVMSPREYNREWEYEDYKGDYSILLQCKAFRIRHLPLYFNRDLAKRLRELGPDVVVMAGGYMLPSVWKAARLKKRLGYRLFFWSESHQSEQRAYGKGLLQIRENIRRRFYRKMDGFWYPGEKALALIRTYANAEAKCFHIPNLIDHARFESTVCDAEHEKKAREQIREKYGLNPEKYVMFAPMRLHWTKGLMPFLEIAAKSPCRERLQLAVAGNGELEEQLREQAETLGVDLKLLGYHEEPDIIELYHGADAFFLPSMSDPSPLTCVEALWCGKPLFVSSYVGNYPEAVRQGENGFVFDHTKQEEAAQLLARLVDAPADWQESAAACSRSIAREVFSLQGRTKRLLDEMAEV